MFLLSRFRSGLSHPHYEADWALYPNLAMDLIVPPIAMVISAAAATKVFLILSQVLIYSGAMAFEKAIKGRIEVAPVVAALCFFSVPLTWGFVNFQFGLGVALWGLAAMTAVHPKRFGVRFVLHGLMTFLLFASHLFALGIYGFTLGLWELWRTRSARCSPAIVLSRFALLATPPLVLAILFMISGASVGGEGTLWLWRDKILWPLFFLNGYNAFVAALSAGVLFLFVYIAARNGRLKMSGAGVFMASGFILLYAVFPSRPVDTSYADVRLLPALLLILPAFVSINLPSLKWRVASGIAIGGVLVANYATAVVVSREYEKEYAALISSFAMVEKGARVLIAHGGEAHDPPIRNLEEYPMYNAPTLAVHYADAFTPSFFTAKGKQPIAAKSHVASIDAPYAGPVPVEFLTRAINGGPMPKYLAFAQHWRENFDYVYILWPEKSERPKDGFIPLAKGRHFGLYRIEKE